MSKIVRLMKALLPSTQSRQDSYEAYLAELVEIHDVERRMREVTGRGRSYPSMLLRVFASQ